MILTIVSAFTVLAGFIVKEGLDENAKDLLSAITFAAQGRDHAQEDIGMWNQLTGINGTLGLIGKQLIEGKPVRDNDRQMTQFEADRAKAVMMVGANLAALHSEMTVLPADFRQKESEFESQNNSLSLESGAIGNDPSKENLTKYSDRWNAISNQSRMLVGEGIREMNDLNERTERLHILYTWISYSSFIVGWTVGLLSNLAGVKAS
jgi:hypothetical protein